MTLPCANPALHKMLRPLHRDAAPDRPAGIEEAFTRALRRAAAPYEALQPTVAVAPPDWDRTSAGVAGALPEPALLALLDGPANTRALLALENTLVDALIEVQTTGKVDPGSGAPRPTTKIDAALCRDFIGLLMTGFAAELAGRAHVTWPPGLSYGTHLADPRQLGLLLPDQPYHLFRATVSVGGGAKTGQVCLAVPVTGEPGTGPVASGPDPGWSMALKRAAAGAPLQLDAVLLRRRMPLADLSALRVGDMVPFDASALAQITLTDARGAPRFSARLGQKGGDRAVRLTNGAGLAPPPPPPEPPTPQPVPPSGSAPPAPP